MEQQHTTVTCKQQHLPTWKRLVLIASVLFAGVAFSIVAQPPTVQAKSVTPAAQVRRPHHRNNNNNNNNNNNGRGANNNNNNNNNGRGANNNNNNNNNGRGANNNNNNNN